MNKGYLKINTSEFLPKELELGSLAAFLGGAGSKIYSKWKNDKKLINELIKDLPEDAYYDSLVNSSVYVKSNVELISQNSLNQYLNKEEIESFNDLLNKRFNINKE